MLFPNILGSDSIYMESMLKTSLLVVITLVFFSTLYMYFNPTEGFYANGYGYGYNNYGYDGRVMSPNILPDASIPTPPNTTGVPVTTSYTTPEVIQSMYPQRDINIAYNQGRTLVHHEHNVRRENHKQHIRSAHVKGRMDAHDMELKRRASAEQYLRDPRTAYDPYMTNTMSTVPVNTMNTMPINTVDGTTQMPPIQIPAENINTQSDVSEVTNDLQTNDLQNATSEPIKPIKEGFGYVRPYPLVTVFILAFIMAYFFRLF